MAEVKEVCEEIFRIQAKVPGSTLVCTVYFIRGERNVLELSYVIPTHVHLDHAGATAKVCEAFPGARVILHPLGKDHVIEVSRLVESTKKAYGSRFEDLYGSYLPVPAHCIDTPSDGEVIGSADRPLQIAYSPGHALHHISIIDWKTGGLFCGEALGMRAESSASSPLPNASPPTPSIFKSTLRP